MKKIVSTNILITGGLLAATFISFGILTSNIVRADASASVNAAVTVPEACTMTGSGTSHTANMDNGTYRADIGSTTLKVVCNDANGFSIYAIGYTGDQYSGANHTKLVGSNSAIVTGTATSAGNDDVSNWAMKLTTNPSATYPVSLQNGYGAYSLVPDTYTKVATRTSGTDVGTNATGAELTTTYAAYISKTQPADTYTGQVKYTLVHPNTEQPLQPQPSTAGCITYYANASDSVGTMGTQCTDDNGNPLTDNTTVTLYTSNFSRSGYGFAGWSDAFDYATNPNANLYGSNETITAPTGTTANGLSLYAIWIESTGSLQDSTKVATLCGSGTGSLTQAPAPGSGTATLSSVTALTDERDNQVYAIAKLADGNCWMIENLRLENTASHNTDGSLAQGYDSSFIGLATPESANFSNSTTANSLYSTDGSTDATISGRYQAFRFPRYNNSNTSNRASNTTNTDVNTYSDGNYYTWRAAIADTTNYSGGDHGTTSICPTGWRLPIGNQSTADMSFGALSVALGGPAGGATAGISSEPTGDVMSARFRSYPNNFLYSGYFYELSARDRGSYGTYWSSTAYNYGNSCYLYLTSSCVRPGTDNNNMFNGRSIRCLAGS